MVAPKGARMNNAREIGKPVISYLPLFCTVMQTEELCWFGIAESMTIAESHKAVSTE